MASATRTWAACLASVANDNRPTMADALAEIGRPNPDHDWLLDIDFVALNAKWAADELAERAMFTDDYGRSL